VRTNLRFSRGNDQRQVIVVASAVRGEGRTTTVVRLATAMAVAKRRVLVIDCDLRGHSVATALGLAGSPGLTSVLTGDAHVAQVIQPCKHKRFDVLASGPTSDDLSELLASAEMEALLVELRRQYDMIVIDSPALLSATDAATVAPLADGVVLLCRYRKTTRSQLKLAFDRLQAVSATVLGTVLTMAPDASTLASAGYDGTALADESSASASAQALSSAPTPTPVPAQTPAPRPSVAPAPAGGNAVPPRPVPRPEPATSVETQALPVRGPAAPSGDKSPPSPKPGAKTTGQVPVPVTGSPPRPSPSPRQQW
jgi:capsular exopolysaccharide synthesis family protein